MRVVLALATITLSMVSGTEAQDVRWQATLIRYGSTSSGYDAWSIISGELPKRPYYYNPIAPPANFESTLEAIFDADKDPCINSIVIRKVSDIDELREQVVAYLTRTGALAPYMATEPRRWKVKGLAIQGPELLRRAILKSDFVASLDRILKKKGKSVRDASVNNVAFLFEEDPANWLATINLYVDE